MVLCTGFVSSKNQQICKNSSILCIYNSWCLKEFKSFSRNIIHLHIYGLLIEVVLWSAFWSVYVYDNGAHSLENHLQNVDFQALKWLCLSFGSSLAQNMVSIYFCFTVLYVCGKQISSSRPLQMDTGAFCGEFMSSSESVWKRQFFATLLTDSLHLTHLCKPIIPFSPSLLLHLDQSPIETSNRTVLSYLVFSLLPIPPPAFPKESLTRWY